MNADKESNTDLSEVKSTELKSIYEKILYSKVFGTIDRQYQRFGYDSIAKRIEKDGFYSEVLTGQYYERVRKCLFEKVIRRVVDMAQRDYLNNYQDTYKAVQSEFEMAKRNKEVKIEEVI